MKPNLKSGTSAICALIAFAFCGFVQLAHAQTPTINYITPDAAAKGMTVAVEFIGPAGSSGNFGSDGLYAPGAKIQLQNASDSQYVILGPTVVSWDGKLAQVMVLIRPNAANATVPLVAINGASTSSPINFQIVTPQAFGTKIGGGVIGGGLGTRTTRGTMVVDSMVLMTGTYTVATTDIDAGTPGNQAYLPLRILSAGPIRFGNATLSVAGQNASGGAGGNGGAGGGGGGGGTPSSGGAGYTGGGGVGDIGGTTRTGGTGTGSVQGSKYFHGGSGLSGVLGGLGTEYGNSGENNDEGGGGGTGHPFGTSGTHGLYGSSSAAGGYGAGSGGGQGPSGFPFTYATYGGGGAGFANNGAAGGGSGNNAGFATGNVMISPLAGGSGGGSANIWYSSGNSAGNGGGGGGAVELTTYTNFSLPYGTIDAHGGNGSNGSGGFPANPSGGGGGSGGAVVIGARDSISIGTAFQSPTLNVNGGTHGTGYNSGGDGAAGRVRLDGRVSNQNGNLNTSNYFTPSKDYVGPNTSYINATKNTFTINGYGKGWVASGDLGNSLLVYYRFPSTGWRTVSITTTNPGNSRTATWTSGALTRSLLPQDSVVYIVALQNDPNAPGASQYLREPQYAMTHTGGMIAHLPGSPRIATRDTIIDFGRVRVGTCKDTSFKVLNIGTALLRVDTAQVSGSGLGQFDVRTLDSLRINQGDSSTITISFCPTDTICYTALVTLNSNDTLRKLIVLGCGIQPQIQSLQTIDFGIVKVDACKDTTFNFTNSGNDTLHVTRQLFGDNHFKLIAPALGYVLKPGAQIAVTLEYCATDTNSHRTGDTVRSDARDSIHVITLLARGKIGILSVPTDLDFGAVSVGSCKDSTFSIANTGTDSISVTRQLFGLLNFTLVKPPTPYTLAPGASINVTLEYCATDTGTIRSADTLHVNTRDSSKLVILHGHSGYGILSVIAPIDFGLVDVGSCKDTAIQLSNIGTDTLTLVTPPVFSAGFTVPAGQLPISIAPGSSKSITLRFCPTDTIQHTSSDSLRARKPGIGKPITVTGKGIRGILTTPNSLDLGCVVLGQTIVKSVTLKNVGPASVTSVQAAVVGSTDLTILKNPSNSIASNATDSVTVQFTATKLGVVSAQIEVTSSGSTVDIPVTAKVSVAPQLVVLDTNLNFDTVTVGDSVTLCVRVMNPSCVALDVKDLSIASTHAGVFHLAPNATPQIIADSAITQLCITFRPTQNALEEGFVTFVLDSGTAPAPGVHLIGQGAAPVIQVHPQSLDFGDVLVLTTSAPQTVQVVNLGIAIAQTATPSIVGANASEFSFTGLARAIGRNDSIAYSLTMSPATVGVKTAYFVIPVAGGLDSVLLTGRGVQPGILVSRQRIDFGKVDVNPAPIPQQTFVVKNTGSSPLTVTSIVPTGDASFTMSQVPPGSITMAQPTDSIIVTVSFNPTSTGVKAAQIAINNTSADQPVVDLAGEGIQAVLSVSVDTVDFGNVYLGAAKDSIKAITITNTGYGKMLTVTSATIVGANPGDFVVQIPAQGTLQPGESRSFDARFVPSAVGPRSADLQVSSDVRGGGKPSNVHLEGNGLSNGVPIILFSDTIYTTTGSHIQVPIMIDKDLTVSKTESITFRVQFDPQLLYLSAGETGPVLPAQSQITMKSYSRGDAEFTITSPAPIAGPGTIANLDMEVLVAPTSSSPVKIITASFGNSAASLATLEQGLVVTRACDTSIHVVLQGQPVSIAQNSPNPFNPRSIVNVTVRAAGRVRLLVYDQLGREVLRPLDRDMQAGEYQVAIDASHIASGSYRYAVEWQNYGQTIRETKTMTVVK